MTVDLSEFDRVTVRELVPFAVMVPLDSVTPPVLWPGLPDVELGGDVL